MKTSSGGIRNIVVISDLHSGCRLSLCHPSGAQLDFGGFYSPSELQIKLWGIWREFWDEWVPTATKGEPYIVIVNGDALDGVHHNSTTQISHDLEDQVEIAFKLLSPITELCEGRFYMVRGTDAHVGQSGVDEEKLAKKLGAKRNEIGQRARFELWIKIGGKRLVHLAHHIGSTGSMSYETTAIMKELTEMFADSARWGNQVPDVIVRSHRHRHIEVRVPTKHGYGIGFVTPGWQLRTPFSYRIPGGRVALPQIGGSLIRFGDRELFTEHMVRSIERPPSISI